MTIDLYYAPTSAPCRAVLLAAKALNVNLNLKLVDLQKGEQMKPEFLKLNPQHTVPVLVDDGFALSESRAIVMYLANKYGKGSSLYPEEPKARALVDQRLFFHFGTLYMSFRNYFYPMVFYGASSDAEKLKIVKEALAFLDLFLEGEKYVAGPNLTIADLNIVTTISSMEAANIDFLKYSNIKRWYQTIKTTAPGYKEMNEDGLNAFKEMVKKIMNK